MLLYWQSTADVQFHIYLCVALTIGSFKIRQSAPVQKENPERKKMSAIAVILTLSLKNRPTSVNTNRKAHKASLPLCAKTHTQKKPQGMHTQPLDPVSEAWLLQKSLPGVHSEAWTQEKRVRGGRNFKSKHRAYDEGWEVGGGHLGWRRAGMMRDNGSRCRSCTPANGIQFVVPSARVCATVAVSCAGSALLGGND